MPTLADLILEEISPLLSRVQLFFHEEWPPEGIAQLVWKYADSISTGGEEGRVWARRLMVAVHGSVDNAPAEWWRTPLGQTCFAADAFPPRPATTSEAAAVLNVTTQRVREMLEGSSPKLVRVPSELPRQILVDRASLATRWRWLRDGMPPVTDGRPLADDCDIPD